MWACKQFGPPAIMEAAIVYSVPIPLGSNPLELGRQQVEQSAAAIGTN